MKSMSTYDITSHTVYLFSHVGNTRSMQEDNFLVGRNEMLSSIDRKGMSESQSIYSLQISNPSSNCCAFVCDGMGGHAHGEIASLTAVQLLQIHYDELLQSAAVSTEAIQEVISKINDEFCHIVSGSPELYTMGTTLCGVIAKDYLIYGINVGDSRLYSFNEGVLKQISMDHTEGNRLLNLGFLTEKEFRNFPNRKAIYKHIGQIVNLKPDVFCINNIISGSILLICTDGLTDALNDEEISNILHFEKTDLKQCGRKLIEEAITRNVGFGDNITLMLIEF